MNFDYLIAGAGSAGCVLAARLSEDPSVSVCLIEAGEPDNDWRIKMPLGLVLNMGGDRFNWAYQSAPQANLGGTRVKIPRGKTWGGSHSINSMLYVRGRPSDYDRWAGLGCDGWGWQDVLPYFLKSENNRALEGPLHSNDGPLIVDNLPDPHPLNRAWVTAGRELQIPESSDINGASQEGLCIYQATLNKGRRWSVSDAYLKPALAKRKNLTVLSGVQVERVLFDGKRATGLKLVDGRSLEANKEVILSSGAIGSPEVLLRSGVGPAAELKALGIEVALDLPGVGKNLHDHPAAQIHLTSPNAGYGISWRTLPSLAIQPFKYLFGEGMLSSVTVESGGFARTNPALTEPDVQFHFIPARMGHQGKMIVWGQGYNVSVCVLNPTSKGALRLKGPKVSDGLEIDFNLLETDFDRQTMLNGFHLMRRLLAAPSFDQARGEEVFPGPEVQSDEQIMDWFKKATGTAYHPVGTCKMGSASDLLAVVTPDLKVKGLEGLRVIDASVMPEVIAGNTNAPTIMIAEKAADLTQ